MVYDSLTDIPRNLKEGIDWLIALRGTHAGNNFKAMGAAVYNFLADKPVGFTEVPALEEVKVITKEFLEQEELKDLWPANAMLTRFDRPVDKNPPALAKFFKSVNRNQYTNVVKDGGITSKTIADTLAKSVFGFEKFLKGIKDPGQYKSAYSSEATWDASCAKNPEDCAAVFVGIAPMLYAGLYSLIDASYKDWMDWLKCNKRNINLGNLLKAVGYVVPERRDELSDSDVRTALSGVSSHILETLYDLSGFWAFY
ncbi:hypothetical protein, conserved [Babesia ovata]|uniref:Uncharacterized protein n=1 Tax=Babesia ovata TaxID=189622 RepID=A0A2H6KDB3_9APIC|nr:uncharacterized protein BOVATA_024760 [Babesia ovata]GBE60983.1 hypothetical protein, conserved [Babesia ovata]